VRKERVKTAAAPDTAIRMPPNAIAGLFFMPIAFIK
jgi:hypothetical protein